MSNIERFILTAPPVKVLIRLSKKLHLPGFEGVPLYDVIVFFIDQVKKVGFTDRAAAISFNLLMAIPPACIFIFTLIPYLPVAQMFNRELLQLTKDLTPNENTYDLIKDFLYDFLNKPRTGLLSFGFILAAFYSSNAMLGIMRGFDRSIYEIHQWGLFGKRWKAIKLTTLLFLLLIATIMLLSTQGTLLTELLNWLSIKGAGIRWLISSLRWLIILALFFFSIALIYRYGPSVEKKWRIISPGSILATTLMILFIYLFSFWVNNFGTYNKVYGSIGTILILMVLIYFSSLVMLIGFELNVSIKHLKELAEEREKEEEEEMRSEDLD